MPLAQLSGASADTDSAQPVQRERLPAEARTRLDRGNDAFRRGDLDGALMEYRAASAAAPGEPAPLYGIYMVASRQGLVALRDSAMRAIAHVTGAPVDSNMQRVHKRVTPNAER